MNNQTILFKQKVQELKRELILKEATKLFIKDGYENMKISELSKNAGVSVGPIYCMFGSKEALYNHYIMSQVDYYIGVIEEEIKKYTDPIDMLKELTKIKFSAIIENRNAIKENVISNPTFFLQVSTDEDDPLTNFYIYVAEYVMRPLSLTLHTDKEPLEMFFLHDGITYGMIKYWMLKGGDLMSRVDEAVESFLLVVKE